MIFRLRATDKPKAKKSKTQTAVAIACWTYIAALLICWLLLRFAGETWWVATVMLFGPRWVVLLPLILLLPLTAILRPKYLIILALGISFALAEIMGLCIPWKRLIPTAQHNPTIRILTLNTHYNALDGGQLAKLIESTNPDIVALQEFDPDKTRQIFQTGIWHIRSNDYSCVASRFPVQKMLDVSDQWDEQDGTVIIYKIQTPVGIIPLINIHLSSPHGALLQAVNGSAETSISLAYNSAVRTQEAKILAKCAEALGPTVLMAGDFNLTTDSRSFRNNLSTFTDAFSQAGFGFGSTYYNEWTITRIDHILAGDQWQFKKCWVAPNLGVPHRPVIADLELKPNQP